MLPTACKPCVVHNTAKGLVTGFNRDQLNKVQAELTYTSNKCNALSQENNLLREHSIGAQLQAKAETDPLAEQVALWGPIAKALSSAFFLTCQTGSPLCSQQGRRCCELAGGCTASGSAA